MDDAAGEKLNEESEVIHVIQVIESRISMTREDRIQRLVETGALMIEKWMREQHEPMVGSPKDRLPSWCNYPLNK